jgi:hypothetical protein
MSSVAHNPIPAKAWYCSFHGLAGVLTKPADHVLFPEDASGAVVTITDTDMPHLVINGAVADAMAQYCTDMAAGGYHTIACSRAHREV